ncbi:MAG: SPOR domain-containing protein [Campylobacteraceae bacterium]|jgi:DedD protein|nr:SPOR domain-containing protein [Campylobacteraceae bacterium]
MEEHELSDILLEQVSSKNSTVVKVKRLIIIAVLLILLFIVVLLIMKFINKSDEQPQNKLTQTMLEESANIPNTAIVPLIEETGQPKIIEDSNVSPQIIEIDEPEQQTSKPPIIEIEQPQATPIVPPKQNIVQGSVKSGWYIQVSSASKTPAKSFLDNIAKKGYSHSQYKTTVNARQVTKVLIGPYASDKAARDALSDIKSNINKDAFVYQVK